MLKMLLRGSAGKKSKRLAEHVIRSPSKHIFKLEQHNRRTPVAVLEIDLTHEGQGITRAALTK
jgi:hypothetical protein